MTTSRNTVLTRVRAALAGDDRTPGAVPRDYLRKGQNPPGSEPVVELLIDRLIDYRAQVEQVTAADLPAALTEALSSAATVVVADDLDPGIARSCAAGDREVITDTGPNPLSALELDQVDAVVTTARVAIALSGTIILDGGPGQGRRVITLIPDLHVIILTANQVVETVAEAVALLPPTAPLTMIAGPSATSDIELERVEGVHGPRTLHVLIVR